MKRFAITLALSLLTACAPSSSAALTAYDSPTHTMFWMNVNGASTAQTERIDTDIQYLTSNHIDLGVLAELNPVEAHEFATRSNFALVYSADPGYHNNGNGVFYDRTVWRMIGHSAVATYSWNNERVITEVPYLEDRTGLVVAVFPLHNPWSFTASDNADMRIQASTAQSIRSAHPAWRVIVAGDFNMTATARNAMTSSGLRSPDTSWTPIDQAFTSGLTTSEYRAVRTTATDHNYQYQFKF